MNDNLRALFPMSKSTVYMNHAAVAPPPTNVLKAVSDQLNDVATNGSLHYRSWVAVKERARKLVAGMIGARSEQIAFMRNTSDGIATVANGLRWNPGDNIVTFRREFPSNVYPWLRLRQAFDVEVRMCEEVDGRVDVEGLINLIDENTKVVAISQVQYGSGHRVDLERLGKAARKVDALLVVDVIQALGVIPTNVEDELVDVAAAACHKWLLAPEGIGLLYLSDRARERIEPTLVGWVSVRDPEDYLNFEQEWKPGALAWETGTGATALLHGLEASLELLTEIGIDRIASYLEELTDYLCGELRTRDYEIISSRHAGEKSQIVCIRHRGNHTAMDLYSRLKKRGIIIAPRGDRLRIAPHLYNLKSEMDSVLDALP